MTKNAGENAEKLNHSHIAGGNVNQNCTATQENRLAIS